MSPKIMYYVGIKILNSLPCTLTSLLKEKSPFKVALNRYLNTLHLLSIPGRLYSTLGKHNYNLSKIWGFHSGKDLDCSILRYDTV
jgi:hypothetical protein